MNFQKLFMESKGQPITYKGKKLVMVDKINLKSQEVEINLVFVSTDSKWEQGVILQTKGGFEINERIFENKIVLWEHTALPQVKMTIVSKNSILIIYNVWKTEDGTIHYWHNGGAMNIEDNNKSKTYYCNDGYADDDLNDLIFRIDFN